MQSIVGHGIQERSQLGWVHWYNTRRLHGYLDDMSPAEFEVAYNDRQAYQQLVENQ